MKTYWRPAATFGGVIDVSHHNGPIKWSLIPPEIKLVFIKASQGGQFVDPMSPLTWRAHIEKDTR